VTEIEAYGSEWFPETGEKTTVNENSIQELNLSLTYRFRDKIITTVGFFVKQSDSGDISINDSIRGVFKNIYSDTKGDHAEGYTRNVTRFYNAAITWYAHKLLRVRGVMSLSQEYDSNETKDIEGHVYSLSLFSSPLPALNTSVSYTHSESYNFGQKNMVQDTVTWGVTSEIYRNIKFTNDIGYSVSTDLTNNRKSKSYFISGSFRTRLTPSIFTYLNYNLNWSSSDGESSSSEQVRLTATYTPGRLLNITGNFRLSHSAGEISTSEGIGIYWRFLPALHYSLTYQLTTGDRTIHAFNTSAIWYMTRFLRLRVNYGYTLLKETVERKNQNILVILSGRI
jgi:hypothetical protein